MDEVKYPTVEHAYQASKTIFDGERARILEVATPGEAKRRGRYVTLRPDWDKHKVNVMYELLRQKFHVISLAHQLAATGDEELIEGNDWRDSYWGVYRGEGKNVLGKLLMKVREEVVQKVGSHPLRDRR